MTMAREQWAEQLDAALAGERVTARYFPQRLAPGERGGHERRALAVAPPHLIIFRITPKRTTTGKLNWDDPELETTRVALSEIPAPNLTERHAGEGAEERVSLSQLRIELPEAVGAFPSRVIEIPFEQWSDAKAQANAIRGLARAIVNS